MRILAGISYCRFLANKKNNLLNYKMSQQKNLLNYFKKTPKRPLSNLNVVDDEKSKRTKLDNKNESKSEDIKENGSKRPKTIEEETKQKPSSPQKYDTTKGENENEKLNSLGTKTFDIDGESNTTDNLEDSETKTPGKNVQMTLSNGMDMDKIRQDILEMNSKFPIVDQKMGPSWFKALKMEFNKPYFEKLNNFVVAERKSLTIYPPPNKVWTWTKECSLENIKVVILGQDPYHNPNQAHGLCFSVEIGTPPPPSLINMYKELTTDIEGFTAPKHGYLVGWARQGVLLLNACLTVRKNQPNSHKDQGWENLTSAVIKYLNDNREGIVFLLWGAYAQKKADFVDKKKHHVLKTVHPSPLSASRGWFGCKHFSKCNEYLESIGKKPIDWGRLPAK